MSDSLFSRLASYSQNPNKKSIENFTTEVLSYLINHDPAFRRAFLRHIIVDRRILRRFSPATAQPQQSFDRGIVDLVVSGRHSSILVEVKIAAAETLTKIRGKGWVPQIKKYVAYREGDVAYLTTRRVPPPEIDSRNPRFLGHFFFDDLHRRLIKARLSVTGQLFVKFMEENGMESQEPFTSADVRGAQHAFRFARKCETAIDEIVSEIQPWFKKWFHTRADFTRGKFSPIVGSAYAYANVRWRGLDNIEISICIWPEAGELVFGVSVGVSRSNMKKVNRFLAWDEDNRDFYTRHPISGQADSKKMIPQIRKDLKQLRGGLSRAF